MTRTARSTIQSMPMNKVSLFRAVLGVLRSGTKFAIFFENFQFFSFKTRRRPMWVPVLVDEQCMPAESGTSSSSSESTQRREASGFGKKRERTCSMLAFSSQHWYPHRVREYAPVCHFLFSVLWVPASITWDPPG